MMHQSRDKKQSITTGIAPAHAQSVVLISKHYLLDGAIAHVTTYFAFSYLLNTCPPARSSISKYLQSSRDRAHSLI